MKRDYSEDTTWIYPDYKARCISNISSLIFSLFGIKGEDTLSLGGLVKKDLTSRRVILFIIDGFGYTSWERYANDYEFFDVLNKRGIVIPLTTVFPSSTAPALNTIHSGLTPQEHGLLEWYMYFEEVDEIITTLPFTPIGEEELDKALRLGADPKVLFNERTIYESLRKEGIESVAFVNEKYIDGVYSKVAFRGANKIPYKNFLDLITKLREALRETGRKTYYYVYWGDLDSIAHEEGPHTKKYLSELQRISQILKKELLERIERQITEETILLVTADHGQIRISPEDTIYLDEYQEVRENLAISRNEKPILPWGGFRDVFLQIKQEKLNIVFNVLTLILEDKAKIIRSEDALQMGLFGLGAPKEEFLKRIGNLIVIPYDNQAIWYKHFQDEKVAFHGHHGGLTKEEMLVPLAMARLSDLK